MDATGTNEHGPKLGRNFRVSNRWIGLVLIVFSAIAATLASGCRGEVRLGCAIPPEGRMFVGDVQIFGNEALDEAAIVEALRTHSDNFSLDEKPMLDRADAATDARRIESFYAAQGYFAARVTDLWITPIDDYAVRVNYRVDEGPATTIADLEVTGLWDPHLVGDHAREHDARHRRIQAIQGAIDTLVPLREGEIWTEAKYRASKKTLRRALRDRGMVFAEVLGSVEVDREAHEAKVLIRAVPGPLARIASVTFSGVADVPEARLLRRVEFAVGDIPDARGLRQTERNIQQLGLHFSVSAQVSRPTAFEMLGDTPATVDALRALDWNTQVDVELTVQEMPHSELRLGVGLALDAARSDAFIEVAYHNRDVGETGEGRDLSLSAAFSWVLLPNIFDIQKHGPGGLLTLSYREPSVFEEYISFRARTQAEVERSLAFDLLGLQSTFSLSRQFFGWLTAELALNIAFDYYFEYTSDIENLPSSTVSGLDFCETCLLVYPEQVLSIDLRDSPFDAREGLWTVIRLQEGFWRSFDTASKSLQTYIRLQADIRGYWSPTDYFTLAGRFKYGQVFPLDGGDTPLSAYFTGGGAVDHRGYGSLTMGPSLCELTGRCGQTGAGTSRDDYVGGQVSLLGSFEARFRLPADFGIVAFVDIGEIWSYASDVRAADLKVAVGPGLRYFTPFGPIRLDLAFLVNDPDPERTIFQLHFSIGQAF